MDFDFLKPKERLRLMDLLKQVGIDVSDWGNYKRGEEYAASNPKYCYEWTFQDHDSELIVLNLWYENIKLREESIIQQLNMRTLAEEMSCSPQRRRAFEMDFALQKAARLNWPVRVIICDGTLRDDTPDRKRSETETRMLDDEPWTLESYDRDSGECILVRGIDGPAKYIDQFDESIVKSAPVVREEVASNQYSRNPDVRRSVLERAKGYCEFCGAEGFKTLAGARYLETHHIVPLSELGEDSARNVIALCPNHHRQAHYGENRDLLREKCMIHVSKLNKSIHSTAEAVAD
ncbi:HNH endonuclease [Microbulbifer sp. JMSA004]|uniref:HNH endonuclease n=1 Tax=Microbulbifer sp. JMSA004 TaxID=3243370 RepID=UPI00403A1428